MKKDVAPIRLAGTKPANEVQVLRALRERKAGWSVPSAMAA